MADQKESNKVKDIEQDKEAQPENNNLSETESKPQTGPKKKLYKRTWFWCVVVGGVVAVGLITYLVITISQQNKNKQAISQGWHDLVQESNNVTVLGEKVTDQASFSSYSTELHKLDNMIDDKEFATQKLAGNYSDVQKYKTFLKEFNHYVTDGAKYSDDVINYSDSNNNSLTDLSKVAQSASDNLKNNTSYLTENMPPKIYAIQDVLTAQRTSLTNQAAAQKAQQAQSQAQQQADAKNQQIVQQNTSAWLEAFIAGNAAKIRQYMTSAFQNEYNFNQLLPENRQYTYPVSYRILTTKKQDDGNYKVQANVLYKSHTDSNQYTIGNEFGLVNVSGNWLLNTQKEGSGY